MYTDNFEEEILFIPARKDGEACNHLKIVTAFTDVERISSHLIKLFDGRNKEYVSGIKVDIILPMKWFVLSGFLIPSSIAFPQHGQQLWVEQ